MERIMPSVTTSKKQRSKSNGTGSIIPTYQFNVSITHEVIDAVENYIDTANRLSKKTYHNERRKVIQSQDVDAPLSEVDKALNKIKKPERLTKRGIVEAALLEYIKNHPVK